LIFPQAANASAKGGEMQVVLQVVAKFKEINGKVRTAVENMIGDADKLAGMMKDDGSSKVAEIFGTED
jgi:hypothetical protein